MTPRVGVLVMAHGTPPRLEDLEAFYTRIRRGRPPAADQLAELRARYEAIGGTSPLTARTRAQVEGLQRVLDAEHHGRFEVVLGTKHAEPSIEEAAGQLVQGGVAFVIGIVLTPQQSSMGSDEYLAHADQALEGLEFLPVHQWFDAPGFASLVAERVHKGLAAMPEGTMVLFTAHSLPERVLASGDRYPEYVRASAALVAEEIGIEHWQVAWQSAGRTPEPWIGPEINTEIRALAARGVPAVLVCPIGFVADHLEILYDLDVEAARTAREAGIEFARTPSLNDDPAFLTVLAGVVASSAKGFDS